jgi:hypothetical protein
MIATASPWTLRLALIRRCRLFAALLPCLIAGGGGTLRADEVSALALLDAPIEYAGEFRLMVGHQTFEGTVAHSPGRERRDFFVDGKPQALILRRDIGRAFVIWPQRRWYIEADLHTAAKLAGGIDEAMIDRRKVGAEIVNGEHCSVWLLSGKSFQGRACVTSDGILVKADGTGSINGHDTPISTQLSQISRDPVDQSSFQPPSDYFGLPLDLPSRAAEHQ